jgi:hypothetical protein
LGSPVDHQSEVSSPSRDAALNDHSALNKAATALAQLLDVNDIDFWKDHLIIERLKSKSAGLFLLIKSILNF